MKSSKEVTVTLRFRAAKGSSLAALLRNLMYRRPVHGLIACEYDGVFQEWFEREQIEAKKRQEERDREQREWSERRGQEVRLVRANLDKSDEELIVLLGDRTTVEHIRSLRYFAKL